MVICYGLIVQRVSSSHIRSTSSTSFSNKSMKNPNSPSKKSNSLSNADRKRVTITCAVLVSCFLILWLPFHLVHVAKFVGINKAVSEKRKNNIRKKVKLHCKNICKKSVVMLRDNTVRP